MDAMRGDIKKAIKSCYPTGRAVDHMKPLPSELSMLMFRLDSHPHKIVRASTILNEKAHSYPRRGKIGHTSVTLLIMQALVVRCNRHLALFASDALACVSAGLSTGDHSLVDAAAGILISFNENFNSIGFNSDEDLATLYMDVISQFVRLCLPVRGVVNTQVRLAAVNAVNSVTRSTILATSVGRKALDQVLPALFENIPADDDGDIFDRFNQQLSDQYRLARTQTRLPGQDREEEGLGFRALRGLRSAFDTPSSEQVSRACATVLRCIQSSTGSQRTISWRSALVESVASWCEIQLRFVIVKTLVSGFQNLEVEDIDHQKEISFLLESMFQSDASERGLPVFDVLRLLLDTQHRLITHSWKKDVQPQVRELLGSLRNNIGSLAALNVFPGQLGDMIGVILSGYQAPKNMKTHHPGVTVSDLQNILEILNAVKGGTHKLTFDVWDNTYWLLSHESTQILTFYVVAFVEFATKSHRELWPKGLRDMISTAERDDIGPANYVAIFYCLLALVNLLGDASGSMLSLLASSQHTGLEKEMSGDKSSAMGTELISLVQATILAISKSTGKTHLHREALSVITRRVSQRRWLPGIQYPPHTDIAIAIANTSQESPEFGSVEPQCAIELSWSRSESQSPSGNTIPAVESEDEVLPSPLSAVDESTLPRQRKRSISGDTVSSRKMSIKSIFSVERSRTPSVADLVKRQRSDMRHPKGPNKPDGAKNLVEVVGHLHIDDSGGRGKLTL